MLKGEVAEWPIVQHWKCCVRETGPRVRIPPSPFLKPRVVPGVFLFKGGDSPAKSVNLQSR